MKIWWNGEQIGSCIVEKAGLYVNLSCGCPVVSQRVCRLYAVSKGQRLCIGVLRPDGGKLRLERKISGRSFPAEPFIFCMEDGSEEFYPVSEETDFGCMEKLRYGRWETRGDLQGISISSSTGQ